MMEVEALAREAKKAIACIGLEQSRRGRGGLRADEAEVLEGLNQKAQSHWKYVLIESDMNYA